MSAAAEFREGWRVALGGFLGIAIGVSSLYFYSLGIFLKPLATEFDWTRGEASFGPLVGTGCTALMAIPIGRLADRIGSARLAVCSLALLAVCLAAAGWLASGLISFLALTATLSLLTAGSSPLPFTRMVVASFTRARGLALGLVLAGTGVGSILIPAFLPAFIAANGWRAGYFVLAGVIVLILPAVALLLRTDPARAEGHGIHTHQSDHWRGGLDRAGDEGRGHSGDCGPRCRGVPGLVGAGPERAPRGADEGGRCA